MMNVQHPLQVKDGFMRSDQSFLSNWEGRCYLLAWLAIIAGFVMTVISWVGFCSESCLEVHNYRYFGLHFEAMGFSFFISAAILHALSLWYAWATATLALLAAGGVGSEIAFILIQKYTIGHFCPVCLSIATIVIILGIILAFQAYFRNEDYFVEGQGRVTMFTLLKGFSLTVVFALGFFLALVGVFKPEKSFADGSADLADPVFGNKNSPVEVYFISDWFCPACKRIEPYLEPIYPKIMEKASLIFVDKAIHPESLNYTPYNLSFMVKNKDKYLQLRKALAELTKKTKTPTPEQVQEAIDPIGIKYVQLNYSDIDSGMRFFQGIANTFEVNMTPTMVIANRKSLKARKLVGSEISEDNIMQAIDEMSK